MDLQAIILLVMFMELEVMIVEIHLSAEENNIRVHIMAVAAVKTIVQMFAVELVVIFVPIAVSGLLRPLMAMVILVMGVVLLVAAHAQNNVEALALLDALDALVIVLILVEMDATEDVKDIAEAALATVILAVVAVIHVLVAQADVMVDV